MLLFAWLLANYINQGLIEEKLLNRESKQFNRPLPTYSAPLFQNESLGKTFYVKMSLICIKKEPEGEIHFHVNRFARRLVLTQRRNATRKWPMSLNYKHWKIWIPKENSPPYELQLEPVNSNSGISDFPLFRTQTNFHLLLPIWDVCNFELFIDSLESLNCNSTLNFR